MSDWSTVEQSPVPEVGAPSIVDELAQAAQSLRKKPSSPSVHHDSTDDLAARIAEVMETPPLKHELQWEPGEEGKGFVLTDGSAWTWPTVNLKPMHMAKAYTVKCRGKRVKPKTAFHIRPDGKVWFYGEGRQLDPDDWQALNSADPRLTPTPQGWGPWQEKEEVQEAAPEPVRAPSGYGHGQNVLDILDRLGRPTANTVFDECPECGMPHPEGQPCPTQGGGPVALPEPPHGVVGGLKLAGLTRAQRLRQQQNWNETFGPDRSKVVHQFPDGWTINKLDTNHAECYEGGRFGRTSRLVDPSEVQGLALYHGTNVPHEQVQREGLRPGPSYFDAEADQELLNKQEEPHGLYFTTSPDEARQYGDNLFKLKNPEAYSMYEVGNDPNHPDSTHYTIPASIPAQHLEPHEYDSYFGAHPVEWGSDAQYLAPYRSAIPTGFQEMYHVSPRANRESILQNGLTGWSRDQLGTAQWQDSYDRHNQPPGNYFFDNPDDAMDYVYALAGRNDEIPEEPVWEDQYEIEEHPEGFEDWPEDEQENWYDTAEYHPIKDDPHGYDIWRAQLSGHPLVPDPETRMVAENEGRPWDLGRIHDAYEQQGDDHNEVGGYYGSEANRYYSPVDVHPSRLQLHEHVPGHRLTRDDYYDRLDQSYERESPQPWHSLPLTERPMPGHEAGINENFFTDVMHGDHAPSQTLQGWGPDAWTREFERHRGPFDAHIETSIPGYRANSASKGMALLNAFPKSTVLDIGSSTGAWGKTLSSLSNGQVQTDNLDPNPAMVEHFNSSSQVPGARAVPQAFGESFTDEGGNVVPRFDGIGRYDVVHESMGFQFISNDRDGQIAEAKRMLRPGGVFLTEQKVVTPHWQDSETAKDAWKRNYYSEGDLARKNQEVGFQEKAASMMDMLVKQDDLEAILHKHFAHVAQYWSSGNFVGYAASDSAENLQRYLGEFKQGDQPQAVDITPRMVEPPRRVAGTTDLHLSSWQPDTQNGRTLYTQESEPLNLTEKRGNRASGMGLSDWQLDADYATRRSG